MIAGFHSTILLLSFSLCHTIDVTPSVVRNLNGRTESLYPAAFADVDGDRFTDIILLSNDGHLLKILLGGRDDPVVSFGIPVSCAWMEESEKITSVVPGDFDGDETLDIIVTYMQKGQTLSALVVIWGIGNAQFHCEKPTLNTTILFDDQPLAMDFNGDLIPDIFVFDENGDPVVWTWNKDRIASVSRMFKMPPEIPAFELHVPHSNAFVDVDGDYHSDLILTGTSHLLVFPTRDIQKPFKIPWPPGVDMDAIGQAAYVDADADDKIDLLVPTCSYESTLLSGVACKDALLFVRPGATKLGTWIRLELSGHNGTEWAFALVKGKRYVDTIVLRFGDYDLDGYPDFLATMQNLKTKEHRVVLFRNMPAEGAEYSRTFIPDPTAFNEKNTIMGAFFDLRENGLLDVILVQLNEEDPADRGLILYENDRPVGYDHYFLKVVVFGPRRSNVIGEDLYSAATNVAGATVSYVLDDFVGKQKTAKAVQQSQTAHFALQMPYVVFGLSDVSNFVESFTVGLPINWVNSTYRTDLHRSWYQLIPNSQIYVIPSPLETPKEWKIKLYLTPKHLIGRTMLMLWTLGFAAVIIVALIYWREKMLDRKEKRKEAYMMYFSALRG